MIRVHFPKSIAGEDELEIVPAVRGGMAEYRETPWNRRFRQLFEKAQQCFTAVPPEHADVVFYPHEYRAHSHSREVINAARARGLPLIFIKTGDLPSAVEVPYGVVYRHSIFGNDRLPCERAMPAFCEDMLSEHGGTVPIAPKSTRPSVGFCGYVSNRPMRLAYRLMGRQRKADGLDLRARLLELLQKSVGVDCEFVRNDRFLGGRDGVGNADASVAAKVRSDFVQSVLGSNYTLSVRGAGNFSYRFYEVLSAGRVPLYLNTDGVLPYHDEVDWKKHCVWIEEDEIHRVGEKLVEFHQNTSDEEFAQLQTRNRQLWESYLTPLAFYRRAFERAIVDSGRATRAVG
ncbi:MAG: Exostosin family protein [Myxococcaceae bacterium]|nr:Exostosin family protein [Myxococcaceae bacterium]